jgi:hypothetical protein
MIRGMHGMFYSNEAEALRSFIKDKLAFSGTDVGGGWLIFDAPEADLGVHPTDPEGPPSGTCDVCFFCDDIEGTVAELRRRGVEFTRDIEDHGYGLVTYFRVPGGFEVQLYQAHYAKGGDADLGRHLRDLEESLLQPDVRKSPLLLDLLAEEFVEFASDGRIYSKADLAALLQAEVPMLQTAGGFKVRMLAPNAALLTYHIRRHGNPDRHTLRSSLWRQQGGKWRMVFHQATITEGPLS